MKNKRYAKLDKNNIEEDKIIIIINDSLYSFLGFSRLECLDSAISEHILQDKEFTDDIIIKEFNEEDEEVYAPAILCGLGYIDKGDLFKIIINNSIEEE